MGISGSRAAEIALMVALTAVFIDGLIFLFTAWSGIRERIIKSISPNLSVGISVGIGLFITFIGLSLAGIVKLGVGTPVEFNVRAFTSMPSILVFAGLIMAIALYIYRVPGAFLITIIVLTIMGVLLGLIVPPQVLVQPPLFSTSIVPNFLENLRWWVELISPAFPVAFSLWIVEFFDGMGTIVGLANRAGLIDKKGRPVNIESPLYRCYRDHGRCPGKYYDNRYLHRVCGWNRKWRQDWVNIIGDGPTLLSIPTAGTYCCHDTWLCDGTSVDIGGVNVRIPNPKN